MALLFILICSLPKHGIFWWTPVLNNLCLKPTHSFADTNKRVGTANHSQMGGKNCDNAKQGTSEGKGTTTERRT